MNCELVKIEAIEELSELEDVYNLEVENTHCFAVNGGFIIHNCRYAMEDTDSSGIWDEETKAFFFRDANF